MVLYSTNSRNLLDLRASGLNFEVTVSMSLSLSPERPRLDYSLRYSLLDLDLDYTMRLIASYPSLTRSKFANKGPPHLLMTGSMRIRFADGVIRSKLLLIPRPEGGGLVECPIDHLLAQRSGSPGNFRS